MITGALAYELVSLSPELFRMGEELSAGKRDSISMVHQEAGTK